MNQLVIDTQIRSLIKLTIIKLNEYNDAGVQDYEIRKLLLSHEPNQSSITKLLSHQAKNDYQHLIQMTFVGQLISIFMVFPESKSVLLKIEQLLDQKILELIGYSTLSKQVKNYYYLKKMQTIRLVLQYKLQSQEVNVQFFSKLYHLLRSCLTTDSNTTKQHYKLTFVNIHKHLITHCKSPDILDFIFNSLVNDSLKAIQQFKKDQAEGMRILDSRLLSMLTYLGQSRITQKQLTQASFVLIRASGIQNSYITGLVLSVSQALLNLLTNIDSPLLIITINHTIINPLMKLFQKPHHNLLYITLLLGQVEYLFKHKRLLLSILKLGDINIYSNSLIQKLLTNLHSFVEDEEKKQIPNELYIKLVKQCLKSIMIFVKNILDHRKQEKLSQQNQRLYKIYTIKQKSYNDLVQKFNQEPKSLVKGQALSDYKLQAIAKFIKKSPKINVQKMIEVLGLPTDNSAKLLITYLETFNFKKFSIEQSLRVMLSNFFLIGQSQQIGRVSEQLSNVLFQTDKQKYQHPDNVFLFTSALLILNTDLHNPQNQHKMTEPDWLKMCSTVKGISSQELLIIFQNISKNKIQNFRDISNLYKMNYTSFMYNFYTQQQVWKLSYADSELKIFESSSQLFKYMSYEFLQTILVGKQITKLDKLIDVWEYKQDVYQCQILSIIKTLVSRGQIDVPENAVRRVLSRVNFTDEVTNKILSYYWLVCKIIIQHPDTVDIKIICQIINSTYNIRLFLEDDLCFREILKVRTIKASIKWFKSKSIKKKGSFLDIFANFLGDKISSDEQGPSGNGKKPIAFKKLGTDIFQILEQNKQLKRQSIEYFIDKIRDQKNKIPVGHFIFTLFIIFQLARSIDDPQQIHIIEPLLCQILLSDDSSLSKRLSELQRRKQKKFDLIVFLTKYFMVQVLIEKPSLKLKSAGILQSVMSIIPQCNKDIIQGIAIKIQQVKDKLGKQFNAFQVLSRIQQRILKNLRDNGLQQQFQDFIKSKDQQLPNSQSLIVQEVTVQINKQQVPQVNFQQKTEIKVEEVKLQQKNQLKTEQLVQQKQVDPVIQQIVTQTIPQNITVVNNQQHKENKQQYSQPPYEQKNIENQDTNKQQSQQINQKNEQVTYPQQQKQQIQIKQARLQQHHQQTYQQKQNWEAFQMTPQINNSQQQHNQNTAKPSLFEDFNSNSFFNQNQQSHKSQQIQDIQHQTNEDVNPNEQKQLHDNAHNVTHHQNNLSQFASEEQMLKAQFEQFSKLLQGYSEQHLQKFGLPIYML